MRSLKRQRGFIGIGSAILGGAGIGAVGSVLAAGQQKEAANQARDLQMSMFQTTQANLKPWMESGNMALSDLMTRLGLGKNSGDPNFGQLTHQFNLQDFQESPAYQFNLQQGKLALDKASAARGKYYAPSTLQDIAKYSQGLASNEYQNAFSNYNTNMGNIFNRLNSVSGSGQNAAAGLGTNATAVGAQLGANITGAGNAQAAGTVGVANALTGGLNNFANAQQLQQFLNQNQKGSVPPLVQPMVPGQFDLGAYGG